MRIKHICNLEPFQNWFRASKSSNFHTDRYEAVHLLQFLFVLRLWFHMRRLFCHHFFIFSASFDASGRLCFVIVAFLE